MKWEEVWTKERRLGEEEGKYGMLVGETGEANAGQVPFGWGEMGRWGR